MVIIAGCHSAVVDGVLNLRDDLVAEYASSEVVSNEISGYGKRRTCDGEATCGLVLQEGGPHIACGGEVCERF